MNIRGMADDLGLSFRERDIFNKYIKNMVECEKWIRLIRNNILVMKVNKELDIAIKREMQLLVEKQREQNKNVILLSDLTNNKICDDIYDYIKHMMK